MSVRKLAVKLVVCTAIFILALEYLSKGASISKLSERPVSPATGEVKLGKGISIGNALESPKGVSWGVELKPDYFDYIKEAGFDTVRLPVRFSAYTDEETYILDEKFMESIDDYIDYALDIGLNLILDFHHYEKIMFEPTVSKDKFISIWEQLSLRYKDYPNTLVFEVLNEPKENLEGELLNTYLQAAVKTIRETNPHRLLIIGGEKFNSIVGLDSLILPKDKNIVATFHYYTPNDFAFQGNAYHEGYEHLHAITWTGTVEEMKLLREDFMTVRAWADKNGVEIFLGEFGVVKNVPVQYRAAWIKSVKDLADELGFSWCYWELASHFGIYDTKTQSWDTDILNILTDR